MLKSFDKTKELQSQFNEQLKSLELRMNVDYNILSDLNEFYKRRAVVEQEYSDSLLKLVCNFKQRLAAEQQRRQNWPKYSSLDLINTLIVSSHRTSQTHYIMANLFSQQMTQRILDVQEDVSRLFKQSRELLQQCQQSVTNACSKLHKDHKLYANCYQLADEARRNLDKIKEKLEKEEKRFLSKNKDLEKSSKYKKLKDDLNEKTEICVTKCFASAQARNEYILQLAAVNKAIEKFFSQEIHDVLECMTYGYHNNLSRAILNHINCEEALVTNHKTIVDTLHATMNNIDARKDTGMFLESYKIAFSRIAEFKFQPAKDDQLTSISSEGSLKESLTKTVKDLKSNIDFTIVEVDEIWKTIEEAAKILNGLINQNDYEVADYFLTSKLLRNQKSKDSVSGIPISNSSGSIDNCLYTSTRNTTRGQRIEQEIFYITCLQKYLEKNHKYHTSAAKLEKILSALGEFSSLCGDLPLDDLDLSLTSSKITRQLTKKTHRRLGVQELQSKPRLFGGSLEDYIERTKESIPLVLTMCIQVINLYGMHHQGVFRIPGSQTEINEYKEMFEKGDKILNSKQFGPRDVNSIAGLLKMYFRELVEPVFPNCIFNRLIECSKEDTDTDLCVVNISNVVKELSDSVYVVLRYLFAFLNHLSEYADDNMMDPQNLAICFGPCLMPVPSDLSQLQFEYQPHVNHIVQLFIERHKDIFKSDHKKPHKPIYERFQPVLSCHFSESISEDCLIDNDDISDLSLESPTLERNSEIHATCTKHEENYDSLKGDGLHISKIYSHNSITRCQSTKSSGFQKCHLIDDVLTKPHLIRKLSDSEMHSIAYATAIADFMGSSSRELNFQKGQTVKLYRKLNSHWWEGCVNVSIQNDKNIIPFKIGLIPHSYLRFNDVIDFSKNISFNKIYENNDINEVKASENLEASFDECWKDEMKERNDNIDLIMTKDCIDNSEIESENNYFMNEDIKNEDEQSLDKALAEMMKGFVDLEQKNTIRLKTSSKYRSEDASIALEKKFVSPLSKHTPDLVRDLVTKKNFDKTNLYDDSLDTSSLDSMEFLNVTKMTSADTFAEQGLSTVKKKIHLVPDEILYNEDQNLANIPESCGDHFDNFKDDSVTFENESAPSILAMISVFENVPDVENLTKPKSPKIAPPLAPKPKRN